MAQCFDVRKTPGDTAWFTRDRFGMFIHWGLYAMPARHEWMKNQEKTLEEKYQKYFDHFDPDLYDPKEWARAAKKAGMKYAVLTTKHHEGFCLFDSKYTDYKATSTKAGRDLVAEFVEAFRAEGLKVGFYYSLLDWHHPQFPIDEFHPRRDDPDAQEMNKTRDIRKYAQYMRDQVTELLTNYGRIDILWFDFSYGDYNSDRFKGKGKDEWESEELIALARRLMPGVIIDNRAGIEQDLWTPEQYQPTEWMRDDAGNRVVWEACQTFSGSWGYYRDEMTWKSPLMLVQMLINSVSCGGNLLLNVGPTARGYIDQRAMNALDAIGGWMKYNSRSIYGCTQSEFEAPQNVRYTQNGSRLYIHLYEYPFKLLILKGFGHRVRYAQFLHDASEVQYFAAGQDTHWKLEHARGLLDVETDEIAFRLPVVRPDVIVPVIEVFLEEE